MVNVDRSRCRRCGICVKTCPNRSLIIKGGQLHIKESCLDHGECVKICPMNALSLEPKEQAEL